MVQRIDKQLLQKRAEHNDGELSSLKEVTLHQYDLEKIENLDVYCRHLEILFLQNNQITKIENLNKLKELKYLQLALNNITKIENLEGCESLEKLDLTVNFVDDPLDVESLVHNEHLRELYLVGNPCTQLEGYRDFIITTLPHLRILDGREITRSERIAAKQNYETIKSSLEKRRDEKLSECPPQVAPSMAEDQSGQQETLNLNEMKKRFHNEAVPHTPTTRLEAARDLDKMRNGNQKPPEEKSVKDAPVLRGSDGRVMQRNEGKWDFRFESTPDTLSLHVGLSKFVDTSLIDVDVNPTWIRITVKKKTLQLVLEHEVQCDNVICERSTVTGELAVIMARAHAVGTIADIRRRQVITRHNEERKLTLQKEREARDSIPTLKAPVALPYVTKPKISDKKFVATPLLIPRDFVDDPDVPPLC